MLFLTEHITDLLAFVAGAYAGKNDTGSAVFGLRVTIPGGIVGCIEDKMLSYKDAGVGLVRSRQGEQA